jgi:hypothetical protein
MDLIVLAEVSRVVRVSYTNQGLFDSIAHQLRRRPANYLVLYRSGSCLADPIVSFYFALRSLKVRRGGDWPCGDCPLVLLYSPFLFIEATPHPARISSLLLVTSHAGTTSGYSAGFTFHRT